MTAVLWQGTLKQSAPFLVRDQAAFEKDSIQDLYGLSHGPPVRERGRHMEPWSQVRWRAIVPELNSWVEREW